MLTLATRRTYHKPSCKFIVLIEQGNMLLGQNEIPVRVKVGYHQILKRQVTDDLHQYKNWRAIPCP